MPARTLTPSDLAAELLDLADLLDGAQGDYGVVREVADELHGIALELEALPVRNGSRR